MFDLSALKISTNADEFSQYRAMIGSNRVTVRIDVEDEQIMAEVEIVRPSGEVWHGGEYGIENNAYWMYNGTDGLSLPDYHQEMVEIFCEEAREFNA